MNFATLLGRLQRLKTLAEVVHADDYEATLQEILSDLEPLLHDASEVDPTLLDTLRHRLLGR